MNIIGSDEEFLQESSVIDYNNPAIRLLASDFQMRHDVDIDLAKALFEFVRDEIDHSFDVQAQRVTMKASDVLTFGHGICYAKSNLLAAMLRACDISAGFCYQKLLFEEGSDLITLHGFNGIYLQSINRWVRVDARGNKSGVNAQFDLQKETLAFEVREELGERDYSMIYSNPLSCITHSLQISSSTEELLANLPVDIS